MTLYIITLTIAFIFCSICCENLHIFRFAQQFNKCWNSSKKVTGAVRFKYTNKKRQHCYMYSKQFIEAKNSIQLTS